MGTRLCVCWLATLLLSAVRKLDLVFDCRHSTAVPQPELKRRSTPCNQDKAAMPLEGSNKNGYFFAESVVGGKVFVSPRLHVRLTGAVGARP